MQKTKLTKNKLQEIIREELQNLLEMKSKDIYKQSRGNERFFYDLLSDIEDDMGSSKYYKWLSNELKKHGYNMKVTSSNQADAEERLFQSSDK